MIRRYKAEKYEVCQVAVFLYCRKLFSNISLYKKVLKKNIKNLVVTIDITTERCYISKCNKDSYNKDRSVTNIKKGYLSE